ncbi:MAG: AAA family ATPase [Deltaproteobacteria bacterium]|nr:AAA family ATPase [Deltaproteobacteria bacterium]
MRNVQAARTAAAVVIIGLDRDTLGLVREALAAEAVLPSSSTAFGDAITVVKRNKPDVVLVGFQEHLDAALNLGEVLQREAPNVTLVALATASDASTILAAMRVGYKEYVVLPADVERLRKAVHQAAYSGDLEEDKGLVVSVCGAKGGVGTTTLLSNLAAELGAIHRVIALDLDFSMGDVAPMLDLNPKDTIADVLPRASSMDERLLTGAVAVHRTKVHVLAQPGDLSMLGDVVPDDIFSIINSAAKGYQFVLMDIGTHFDEPSEIALSVSDMVLLVTTPDVISVRDAFRRIKLLEQLGVEADRIRLILNRDHKGAYVSQANIASSLQMEIAAVIPNDSKVVDQAINQGRLIREINRKSDVAQSISTLVGLLTHSDEDSPEEAEEESKGFLFGMFGKK